MNTSQSKAVNGMAQLHREAVVLAASTHRAAILHPALVGSVP